jgi:hypothetical protein
MAIEGLYAGLLIDGPPFLPATFQEIAGPESEPTLDDILRLALQTGSELLRWTHAPVDNEVMREAIIADLWVSDRPGPLARESTIFAPCHEAALSFDSGTTGGKASGLTPMSFGNWYDYDEQYAWEVSNWYEFDPFFSACVMGPNGVPIADSLEGMRANMCPTGHSCVPYGTNGMFVRDTADNHIYMTEAGWNQYQNGMEIDWAGVARDLLYISGGALGGVGTGTAGGVSALLGLGGWALNFWSNGPTQ